MKVEYVSIHNLKPYENNPRKNSKAVDKVIESITAYGFKNPILIDENNVIIAGHTRYKASVQMGLVEVPCIQITDLTEEQKKGYRIADNRTNEFAEWDYDLLKIEIDDLEEFTGFDINDLANLLETNNKITDNEVQVDLNNSICKTGDLWKLGNHYLLCGDATNIDDLKKLINDNKINLLITDPPYNVNYSDKNKYLEKYDKGNHITTDIINDNLNNKQFKTFLSNCFFNVEQFMLEGSVFYIFYSQTFTEQFVTSLPEKLLIKQYLIWVKNNPVFGMSDYHWKHEPILYGWKEGKAHYWAGGTKQKTVITQIDIDDLRKKSKDNIIKTLFNYIVDKETNETELLLEDRPQKNDLHPTMKPIKLISRLISNSSQINDNILDIFGGSGTTLLACEQLNRNCFMIEKSENYCDIIIERWQKLTNKKAKKL